MSESELSSIGTESARESRSPSENPRKRRKLESGQDVAARVKLERETSEENLPRKSESASRRIESPFSQFTETYADIIEDQGTATGLNVARNAAESAGSAAEHPSVKREDASDLTSETTPEEMAEIAAIVGHEAEAGRHLSLETSEGPGSVSNPIFISGESPSRNTPPQSGTAHAQTVAPTWLQLNPALGSIAPATTALQGHQVTAAPPASSTVPFTPVNAPAPAAGHIPMGIPPAVPIMIPTAAPTANHAWLLDNNWQRPDTPNFPNPRTVPYFVDGFPDASDSMPANLTHVQAMNQYPNHMAGDYLLWLSRRYTVAYMVRQSGRGNAAYPNGGAIKRGALSKRIRTLEQQVFGAPGTGNPPRKSGGTEGQL